jgi:Domain of unknown function (DUF222)/HNH endonuclease
MRRFLEIFVDNRTYVRYDEIMKTPTRTPGVIFDEDGSTAPNWTFGALNEELATIGDDDLEVSIVEHKHLMDALHAQWLLRIAEYDRRKLADERHRLTTTGWLRSALRLAGRTTSAVVRQARGLRRMPNVADAAVAGNINPDAVRLLDQARRRHPGEFPDHEPVFAEVATYLNPSDLRQAIGHWEQQIDYPSALARTRAQRRRRRLSITKNFDGMWEVSGELDPETGSVVNAAITSIVDRTYLDRTDRRTPWQARADALGFVCEQWLRCGDTPTSGGTKPHISVTVDAESLLGLQNRLATVDNAPVPPETTHRLSCDATVVRLLLDGEGSPINVGRATRTIPPALRRALDARDQHCQWHGCDAPANWCDAHHVVPWASGGPTDLDNLTLLCRTHHTATHETIAETPTRAP